jgi:hypothetical protein
LTYSEYLKRLVDRPGDLHHSADGNLYTFSLGHGFSQNPETAVITEVGDDYLVARRFVGGGVPGVPTICERIVIPLRLFVAVLSEHVSVAEQRDSTRLGISKKRA